VDAVVHAPFGSYPGEMAYVYGRDETAIREWVEASKTAEGAQAYLDKYVYGVKDHAEYLALVGQERLTQMVVERERRE
jgi:glutaconate CoA-transferase subunit A